MTTYRSHDDHVLITGLITYRETALLASATSSMRDYRLVTKVIAHEMAHQVG